MNFPAEGWYKLTADVNNPSSDRRRKDSASKPLWTAGTLVYVKLFAENDAGIRNRIEFTDKSYAYIGKECPDKAWNRDFCQGNPMLPFLEPAQLTVGRMVRKAWSDPEQLLAALVEYKGVTVEQLQELDKHLEGMTEENFDEFVEKHNVGFLAKP